MVLAAVVIDALSPPAVERNQKHSAAEAAGWISYKVAKGCFARNPRRRRRILCFRFNLSYLPRE